MLQQNIEVVYRAVAIGNSLAQVFPETRILRRQQHSIAEFGLDHLHAGARVTGPPAYEGGNATSTRLS